MCKAAGKVAVGLSVAKEKQDGFGFGPCFYSDV